MEYLFRFATARRYQGEMIADIYNAFESRKSILVNAPTGIGKTDAALAAALTFALPRGMDVFFLTPKMSQHKIVVDALNGIREKFGVEIKFVDLVGKQSLCTNENINMLSGSTFYNACAKAIKGKKCKYYLNSSTLPEEIEEAALKGHNELFKEAFDYGICGYEAAAKLAKTSNVIIADYAHILSPSVKRIFMKKIAHDATNAIWIWDEAHNIVSIGEAYLSSTISTRDIDRANKELKQLGRDLDLSYIAFAMKKIAEQKISASKANEAFISKNDMPDEINGSIEEVAKKLDEFALEYAEANSSKRPAMARVANFLRKWAEDNDAVARIIKKDRETIAIKLSCLYPDSIIDVLKEPYANLFMSGTLTPIGMYKDLFGIEDALEKSYASPFPEENKLVCIDDSITTKYEHRSMLQYQKIAEQIIKLKRAVPGNVAAFFPSYSVLNAVLLHLHDVEVAVQRENMNSMEIEALLRKLENGKDLLLLAVMGGSLSEGIDYANNAIKGVAIVGIPFIRPDLELSMRIAYLNTRFKGKGEDYAYRVPAIIKVLQATGRAIRSEKDRAAIVFMDKRYRWQMYRSLIKDISNISRVYDAGNYEIIRQFWEEEWLERQMQR